ncbi:hypothetical protein RND81_02G007800 [Saponaria officinalis]|uniref:Carbohydrate kinase PfkB domain-containing protein n=1 Tax=Saponaria officinalis TaxID=3572 RepID=A0AAW1MJB2_SAPOF
MHHLILSPKSLISSPNASPFSIIFHPTNPNSISPNSHKTHRNSTLNCRATDVSVLNNCSNSLNSSQNGVFRSKNPEKSTDLGVKDVDVATLGNLCVDIVLNVPHLPPNPISERKAYMEHLASSPPDKQYWEAGGHCNTAIAAARLGLRCVTIGHVGNEIYGQFLLDVLREEGIGFVEMIDNPDAIANAEEAHNTLLCWVLVDPFQQHGFCSRVDFMDEPAFNWINDLSKNVKSVIKRSKILVVNGYGFDDHTPGFIVSALKYAVEVGTSVFFDPGPKGKSLSAGTPEEQMAFNELLKMSDVVLLTSDEAESLTGITNPILAGQELLKNGIRSKWIIIKLGSKGSVLITMSGTSCAPSYKVKVIDTVGCGDSFVGAVAFGFVHRLPRTHTLAIANAVGAATATGCGAGRNVACFSKTIELVKSGDVYEDNEFWRDLLGERVDAKEVSLLSKEETNEIYEDVSCVPLEKIATEVISKLEESSKVGTAPNWRD